MGRVNTYLKYDLQNVNVNGNNSGVSFNFNKEGIMKQNNWIKIACVCVGALLLINLTYTVFKSNTALAKGEASTVGKYQIATWASPSRGTTHHFGYYVLDTTTGKIVDQKSEIHSSVE
jgi:hypothetical protein